MLFNALNASAAAFLLGSPSTKLQWRKDSAAKMERQLQHKRRSAFRSPEVFLTVAQNAAMMHVGDSGGDWGAHLRQAAEDVEKQLHPLA